MGLPTKKTPFAVRHGNGWKINRLPDGTYAVLKHGKKIAHGKKITWRHGHMHVDGRQVDA